MISFLGKIKSYNIAIAYKRLGWNNTKAFRRKLVPQVASMWYKSTFPVIVLCPFLILVISGTVSWEIMYKTVGMTLWHSWTLLPRKDRQAAETGRNGKYFVRIWFKQLCCRGVPAFHKNRAIYPPYANRKMGSFIYHRDYSNGEIYSCWTSHYHTAFSVGKLSAVLRWYFLKKYLQKEARGWSSEGWKQIFVPFERF